jgi:hypothetical protein
MSPLALHVYAEVHAPFLQLVEQQAVPPTVQLSPSVRQESLATVPGGTTSQAPDVLTLQLPVPEQHWLGSVQGSGVGRQAAFEQVAVWVSQVPEQHWLPVVQPAPGARQKPPFAAHLPSAPHVPEQQGSFALQVTPSSMQAVLLHVLVGVALKASQISPLQQALPVALQVWPSATQVVADAHLFALHARPGCRQQSLELMQASPRSWHTKIAHLDPWQVSPCPVQQSASTVHAAFVAPQTGAVAHWFEASQ